jgi:hypothetical protein
MHTNQFRLSALLLALLLGACATPVSTAIKPSEANIAKYNDLSALDVVTALEKNVNDAKAANMPFLAPHYFREASQVLSESQSGLSNKPKDHLVQLAARGDAILEKGRSVMSIVQYRFAQELELKAQLDKLNTAKLLPKEYEKVTSDFSYLIEQVEREKPDNNGWSKEALIKAMQELEVRAVQEGALRESEAINTESKTKNADKQVPATYAEALRVYQDAKVQIGASPHDNDLVQRLGAQALFAARHAQQVNERVIELQAQFKGTSSGSPSLAVGGIAGAARVSTQVGGGTPAVEKAAVERIVLQEEDSLLSISTALGHKDLRDLSLDKQVQEIKRVAAGASLQAKNEAGAAATKNLEARLQDANDATKKAMAQLAEKDQQLNAQIAQLADKDAQIAALNAKVTQLESAAAKPVAPVKSSKAKKKK